MVDDMIKLEIDPKFPKPKRGKRYEKILKKRTLENARPQRQQSASMVNKGNIERKMSYSKVVSF